MLYNKNFQKLVIAIAKKHGFTNVMLDFWNAGFNDREMADKILEQVRSTRTRDASPDKGT